MRRIHALWRWRRVGTSALLIGVGSVAGWLSPGTRAYPAALIAASVVAGGSIARRAAAGLRNRRVGIEALVTVAATGAILLGEVWEAAAVTFLFQAGDALEQITLRRTRRALTDLVEMVPTTAVVLRDGEQVEVPASRVVAGEQVLVKPGARIPVDGAVTEGHAWADESSVTGESTPVAKEAGDVVYAGTVTTGGLLTVEATATGRDTTLARIIARVEEAQEDKAPAQRFIEKFGRWYTPAVAVMAALAFGITRDTHLALTLLVIGCPGALVISIPVSIVAGIGRAAREGILIKGGEHLETAARVDTVAFDKTGTLTTGEPQVTEVVPLATDIDVDEVLAYAASVEQLSEHPLAEPVVAAASLRGLPLRGVSDFDQHAGRGVSAQVDDLTVAVGSERLMADMGVDVPQTAKEFVDQSAADGKTPLLVAVGGRVVGAVATADTLRPGAGAAISKLRQSGIRRIVMLTGDDRRVAQRVAELTGVDAVVAEQLPEDKLTAIRDLQRSATVAMVGDGVNDAPALAAADLGVALGRAATAVAAETADIAVLSDRVEAIGDALFLARATALNLRQNVVVSIATVGLLLAGVLAGQVHMAGGMLIHQLSVLAVIANATRLLRLRLPRSVDRRCRATMMGGDPVARPRDVVA